MNHLSQTLSFWCLRFYLLRNLFFINVYHSSYITITSSNYYLLWLLLFYSPDVVSEVPIQTNYLWVLELIATSPNKGPLKHPWKILGLTLILTYKHWIFKILKIDISYFSLWNNSKTFIHSFGLVLSLYQLTHLNP